MLVGSVCLLAIEYPFGSFPWTEGLPISRICKPKPKADKVCNLMHGSATLCFFMYFLCMITHFYASEGIFMQGSAKPYTLPPGSRSTTLAEA